MVRVAPLFTQVAIDDPKHYPIYQVCEELGLPVGINIGVPGPRVRSRVQHPELLEDVLIDFPELTVIGAHMGHPYEELLINYMRKWDRLYLSCTAYAPRYLDPALLRYMALVDRAGPGAVGQRRPLVPDAALDRRGPCPRPRRRGHGPLPGRHRPTPARPDRGRHRRLLTVALPLDTVAVLARLGAATLGESGGAAMAAALRPVWTGATIVGEALPVRCSPADNLAIHVAVAAAAPGEVLVVQIDGEPERGYWGEVLTTAAEARGVVGLVDRAAGCATSPPSRPTASRCSRP